MSLREIYATLMRRGMPEHQALRPALTVGNCWRLDGPSSTAFIDWNDPVAYDLITMHALRWWYTTEHLLWDGTMLKRGYVMSDEASVRLRRDGAGVIGEGPTILAAILAATERLEPKGDDDAKRP